MIQRHSGDARGHAQGGEEKDEEGEETGQGERACAEEEGEEGEEKDVGKEGDPQGPAGGEEHEHTRGPRQNEANRNGGILRNNAKGRRCYRSATDVSYTRGHMT